MVGGQRLCRGVGEDAERTRDDSQNDEHRNAHYVKESPYRQHEERHGAQHVGGRDDGYPIVPIGNYAREEPEKYQSH